jgi:hypothetical protein
VSDLFITVDLAQRLRWRALGLGDMHAREDQSHSLQKHKYSLKITQHLRKYIVHVKKQTSTNGPTKVESEICKIFLIGWSMMFIMRRYGPQHQMTVNEICANMQPHLSAMHKPHRKVKIW